MNEELETIEISSLEELDDWVKNGYIDNMYEPKFQLQFGLGKKTLATTEEAKATIHITSISGDENPLMITFLSWDEAHDLRKYFVFGSNHDCRLRSGRGVLNFFERMLATKKVPVFNEITDKRVLR